MLGRYALSVVDSYLLPEKIIGKKRGMTMDRQIGLWKPFMLQLREMQLTSVRLEGLVISNPEDIFPDYEADEEPHKCEANCCKTTGGERMPGCTRIQGDNGYGFCIFGRALCVMEVLESWLSWFGI
jgi:hypothetical protein